MRRWPSDAANSPGPRSDRGAEALAARLLARLDGEFYDPAGRQVFRRASPGRRPGCLHGLPRPGTPPAAEALALLAGPPGERAGDIAAGLLDSLDEESVQAPGDELLALAVFAARQPGK